MLGNTISSAVNAVVDQTDFAKTESFESPTGLTIGPGRAALVSLITLVFMMLIILFVGKWLWNNTLVALFPAVKPAKSVWQILGLAVLVSLFQQPCC